MKTKKQTQVARIIAIARESKDGLTRNQINQVTRRERKEIPIQTLCRRLPEMVRAGALVVVDRRECPITKKENEIYRLSASMRQGEAA